MFLVESNLPMNINSSFKCKKRNFYEYCESHNESPVMDYSFDRRLVQPSLYPLTQKSINPIRIVRPQSEKLAVEESYKSINSYLGELYLQNPRRSNKRCIEISTNLDQDKPHFYEQESMEMEEDQLKMTEIQNPNEEILSQQNHKIEKGEELATQIYNYYSQEKEAIREAYFERLQQIELNQTNMAIEKSF